jgi:hypothetical protein
MISTNQKPIWRMALSLLKPIKQFGKEVSPSWLLEPSLRAGLHHGPWKIAFLYGPTSWSNFHDPISLKKQFAKPLTSCKPNVD